MKKDKKDNISFKDALHINLRAIAVFYKLYPQVVISRLFYCSWQALTPYVGIWFSAEILTELSGNRDLGRLKVLVIGVLLLTGIVMLVNACLDRWRMNVSSGIDMKYDMMQSYKMLKMDFQDVDSPYTHKLLSQIREAHHNRYGMGKLIATMEQILGDIFTLLGGLAMTISLFTSKVPDSAGAYTTLNQPVFLLGVLAIMVGITYITPFIHTKVDGIWIKHRKAMEKGDRLVWYYIYNFGQDLSLATDVRIYRQDRFAQKLWDNIESSYGADGLKVRLTKGPMGLGRAGAVAVSVIFTGVAYAFVCMKAWAGAFGIGAITQYVAAITKVANGVGDMLYELGNMRNNAHFVKISLEFLDIPNRMYQGTIPIEKRTDNEYEIAFQNVSFKYPGSDTYALKNTSFTFKVGQKLAVVGMNGSGKTTMIKLLCRLYDPTEGVITLNGIDIRKYDYREYMSIFSVVFQDFKLFSFSLGQNVASGVEVDESKAIDCLVKAGFLERLENMPKGLDTYLHKDFDEKGIEVSGGEAQKIALARALYKDSPFIILDEPTAALDPIAEAEVYSKFNDIVGNKTAIYISHRLSSCRFCDEIVVFDHGEVVQQGSHDVLVADEHGKYHELWYAQAQYYV